uniref:Uncharacterized protein n=1 Tax=Anguilla anguilla TaxID=7936 RepID=A0A0E9T902_ANGAN
MNHCIDCVGMVVRHWIKAEGAEVGQKGASCYYFLFCEICK